MPTWPDQGKEELLAMTNVCTTRWSLRVPLRGRGLYHYAVAGQSATDMAKPSMPQASTTAALAMALRPRLHAAKGQAAKNTAALA